MSDKHYGPGGGVGLAVGGVSASTGLTTGSERTKGVVMILNKLARWAGVAAFSVIVPAAAMAKIHHTHATTAPTSLTSRHHKISAGSKVLARKLSTRRVKGTALKTTKRKATQLKSKKALSTKLSTRKHTLAKLTTRKHLSTKLTTHKHVASKLTTLKPKAHLLKTHKTLAKTALKHTSTPVTPTM
jgi:hypothetical protein